MTPVLVTQSTLMFTSLQTGTLLRFPAPAVEKSQAMVPGSKKNLV